MPMCPLEIIPNLLFEKIYVNMRLFTNSRGGHFTDGKTDLAATSRIEFVEDIVTWAGRKRAKYT